MPVGGPRVLEFLDIGRLTCVVRDRRPSRQTRDVLGALVADPSAWRYGYELGREVGLQSGSLYPILVRLSDRELLESRWEADAPAGRPPRHLYRLTASGLEYAATHVPVAAHGPRARLGRPRLGAAS
jgi:PadR family transcriptional regulator PadR